VGRYPKGQGPRPAGPTFGRIHVGSVVRSRTTFGATVDASQSSAVVSRGRPDTRGDAALATDDARINDRIRARQVRLIGADGSQLGVRALPDALAIARESGLDLVEVAANAEPPVCKIMDFGKYKYEQDQRRKESRKRASNVVIKEMKFRPKIDSHDYDTKMKHVERFLEEGSKVKLTIMFRGREMAHQEIGRRLIERIVGELADIATVEIPARSEGRTLTMVVMSKPPKTGVRVDGKDSGAAAE